MPPDAKSTVAVWAALVEPSGVGGATEDASATEALRHNAAAAANPNRTHFALMPGVRARPRRATSTRRATGTQPPAACSPRLCGPVRIGWVGCEWLVEAQGKAMAA